MSDEDSVEPAPAPEAVAPSSEAAGAPAPEPAVPPLSSPAPTSPARPGFLRRVWNWHLVRPRMEEVRSAAKLTPREEVLLRRARSSLAAGNHLLEAPERTGQGLAGAHAGVLYLESLYWSLLSSQPDLDRPDYEALW